MNDDARKKIFEEFKEMIRTETVVGQPIYLDDATIVPFVDISFGFCRYGRTRIIVICRKTEDAAAFPPVSVQEIMGQMENPAEKRAAAK